MSRIARTTIWLLPLVSACAQRRAEERSSVLLVTLDTVRRDALSCYGERSGTTPHLDRLASAGVLFERAYTTAPITLPAHASLLTGLHPVRHGLRDNGIAALSGEVRTLAEAATEAGCQSAAFVGAVVLDRAFGLDQGFEHYDGPPRGAGAVDEEPSERGSEHHPGERPAAEVLAAASTWLGQRAAERPFFLWIHLYDAHHPYAPRASAPAASDLERYLQEVSELDRELGRFFDDLARTGVLERTLVCVVADHGEAFGEHQELTHGAFCWDTTLRVPLFLRFPDGRRAGERNDALVSVADVAPTLAEALGATLGSGIDGRSLLTPADPGPRGLYFESYAGYLAFGWSPLAGWIDPGGKYVHGSKPEFYDVERDPFEQHDLAAERELEPYRAAIDRVAGAPSWTGLSGGIEEGLRAGIEALGYAGSGGAPEAFPHPLAPCDLPSPQSMVGPWRASLRAQSLLEQGRFAEAEELQRGVLEKNPGNSFVRGQLATSLMRQKRFADALAELEPLLAGPRVSPTVLYRSGVCQEHLGRRAEAIASLERALAADPAQERFRRKLVEVLRAAGELERAAEIERGAPR